MGFIGKLLYAGPMAMFGIFHFAGANDMVGMVPSFLPAPLFFVYFTGLALVLAAVSIIIDKKAKLATQLLGIMLTLFALTNLPKFADGDPSFLKDIALAGASFFMSTKVTN